MLGEGGSDDDEIDRGSNEAGDRDDELLKVPDPTGTDRPGSEDSQKVRIDAMLEAEND